MQIRISTGSIPTTWMMVWILFSGGCLGAGIARKPRVAAHRLHAFMEFPPAKS